jgi:hypothetical protein
MAQMVRSGSQAHDTSGPQGVVQVHSCSTSIVQLQSSSSCWAFSTGAAFLMYLKVMNATIMLCMLHTSYRSPIRCYAGSSTICKNVRASQIRCIFNSKTFCISLTNVTHAPHILHCTILLWCCASQVQTPTKQRGRAGHYHLLGSMQSTNHSRFTCMARKPLRHTIIHDKQHTLSTAWPSHNLQ